MDEKQAIGLMKNLCSIPSPSGEEEKLIRFIDDFLRSYGYDATVDGGNLVIPSSGFYVTTHLDSIGDPAFSFDGRFFYGTSVCDARASIAAILLALSAIQPEDLSFGVALLSDEESGGTGSKKFTAKYKPKMAIVMEPTSLKIANVHYGNLELEMITKTRKAHGSMHEMKNAIDVCLEILAEMKKISPIKPTILKMEGGSDDYVIPDKCMALLDFLIPPAYNASELLGQISAFLNSSGIEYRVLELCDPFESREIHSILARSLEKAGINVEFAEMRSWTDGVNLKASADVVVWGPGDLAFCHTEDEKVELREILKASEALTILNDLLKNENVF